MIARRPAPEIVETTLTTVPTDVFETPPEGPVGLADRVGVFAHSFKCLDCHLEFMLCSWVPGRHTTERTYCPECGTRTPKVHWVAVLSTSTEMSLEGPGTEIFQVLPYGDAALAGDTDLPEYFSED